MRENVNVHKEVFKTAQVERVKFFSNLASVVAKSEIDRLGGYITWFYTPFLIETGLSKWTETFFLCVHGVRVTPHGTTLWFFIQLLPVHQRWRQKKGK